MLRLPTAFLSALLIAWGALSSAAEAQSLCGQRDEMVAGLEKRYAETPVSMGLASNGAVVEVFASESGTWTIIMTHPNGLSCLVVAGEGWEALSKAVTGAGV
jgi:hypothetical protein